jgi:hypothetical protein
MRWGFLLICAVFAYTTLSNMVQRPEGIKIAAIFIGLIIVSSLISRALRSTDVSRRLCSMMHAESFYSSTTTR